jgi:antitoxin (DNA-binding transcriptional repressor) of toxin-antitoxin stability system
MTGVNTASPVVRLVAVDEQAERHPAQLSGGRQQRATDFLKPDPRSRRTQDSRGPRADVSRVDGSEGTPCG